MLMWGFSISCAKSQQSSKVLQLYRLPMYVKGLGGGWLMLKSPGVRCPQPLLRKYALALMTGQTDCRALTVATNGLIRMNPKLMSQMQVDVYLT